MSEHDVVVVGAGPVGLAVTLALTRAGVDVLALDRDGGPSGYPKSRVVSVRSMELLRRWGVAAAVRAASLGSEWCDRIVVARSLAGAELGRVERAPAAGDSPERPALCTQDRLEAVLAAAVGSRVRWDTEVTALTSDEVGVWVDTANAGRLRARYVVCADGVRGLGSTFAGAGLRRVIARQVSVRARIALARWTAERPAFIYYVVDRGLSAQVLVVDGREEWVISALARRGETAEDYSAQRVRELLAKVVGVPVEDPVIEESTIRDVRLWDLALRVADRFRCGRVLRAGDAAHEVLPTGAIGLNLGLADADALAWRLTAVVRGWAAPAILDDYAAERGALGERTAAWTRGNLNTVASILGAAARGNGAVELQPLAGYLDHSGLELVSDGRPGSRAPHVALGAHGSTLDLYGDAPVLLTDRPSVAAEACAARAGVPLTVTHLDGVAWWSPHGVQRDGAVLVRPDGYVCWRADRISEPDLTAALLEMGGR